MPVASSATIPPMTTVPPFGIGSSQSPFATESATPTPQEVAPQKFDFNPERPVAARWLSWSTLLFVLVCAGGYWKYRQMQTESTSVPASAVVVAGNEAAKPASSSGVATPFTALKQAQATIKDAGAKHKAAYDLVDKMLDDPAKAVEAPAKPKAVAEVVAAPVASESTATKSTRDFAAVQLGSDGEFVVPEGTPRPSVNFVRWIKAVKIGGVRLTERPRVLIGANAYTFGDVVDLNLGIVLDGYNTETRMLRFKEPSGAVIERRI